jgi:NAD(P)-dependent dehydrogenase (short-subunit alcohol dehydrogenase family)
MAPPLTDSAMEKSEARPLAGRAAIITGGNRGLGLELARAFVGAGASVFILGRDGTLLRAAAEELRRHARAGQVVAYRAADVSDESAMKAVGEQAIGEMGGLQVLVSNAGVYGPFGTIETVDWQKWLEAVSINLFGSVVAIRAVLPHFKARRYGKIIQLSGGGATNPLPRISAYAASKAAVIRLAETVAEECREFGIDVNAIAPGALNTRLLDEVLAAGPTQVGEVFFARAVKQKEEGGVPFARGVELAVFLASAASDGITGKLVSAVWDDWRAWPEHRDELGRSDAYTLRRITGRDRGFDWGDR